MPSSWSSLAKANTSKIDGQVVASSVTALADPGAEPNQTPSQAKRWRQEFCDALNNIGQNYHDCPAEKKDQLINDLKTEWEDLIEQVKTYSKGSTEHDRTIIILSSFAALGRLERKQGPCPDCKERAYPARGEDGWICSAGCDETPLTDDEGLAKLEGDLWTDLPYLGETLRKYWIEKSNTLTANERERLAVFTAKLLSVGLCTEDTAKCAVWLLKETLEIDRAPVEVPFMIEMLPACIQFITHAHAKLLQICENPFPRVTNWQHFEKNEFELGPLALDYVRHQGLSTLRWQFWRKRFGDLYRSKDERISKLAREGFEIMVGTGRSIGLRIYGEQNFLDNAFEKLDEIVLAARASGGEACASLKQIEIDPDWVERKRKATDSDSDSAVASPAPNRQG